ncbi:MAG: HvfC family RiPP maturation protein [Gammaproteobacteria bacterium]
MAEAARLKAIQTEFAAHLRDPDNNPAPDDIEARRMTIYAELFFNNVNNFLAGNFPILNVILGEERWDMLMRDYFRDHRSHSPLFPDMPKEFLHYVAEERASGTRTDPLGDLPFMTELAHYEWVESGLLLAEDDPVIEGLQTNGDLLRDRPVLSELAWLLGYNWPVDQINKNNQPATPDENVQFYLAYRGEDESAHFIKLNPVSARLFEILRDEECTGLEALKNIATELQHDQPEQVIESGSTILEQWLDKGILRGTLSIS